MNDQYEDCDHAETDISCCPACGRLEGVFCTYCGADCTPDYMAEDITDCHCHLHFPEMFSGPVDEG
jgi:hypothetical protein